MLRLSKKVEYALIALIDMSNKGEGELSTARELSEKFDISVELMGKLLQAMARHEIVASIQGVKGGYYLQKTTEQINMGMIIMAIDGPLSITDCASTDDPNICKRYKVCHIHSSMQCVQKDLKTYFDRMTLKRLKEENEVVR